ncbi:hypothetical protein E2C01_027934 [Portunus trituberculatus]|uniref:Uncharacterized protein n=1 Tax=Portunus trituberculatus TaxID=210409 RepID=A0A5B7EK01_PORTR|nr:hypothetical protein [Portunus trituberculatus]
MFPRCSPPHDSRRLVSAKPSPSHSAPHSRATQGRSRKKKYLILLVSESPICSPQEAMRSVTMRAIPRDYCDECFVRATKTQLCHFDTTSCSTDPPR